MDKLEELSRQMRADWDRRVNHDYRFWMSDGWSSDTIMWESGERDLAILLQDLPDQSENSFLEIGCGVGRLLRAASKRFAEVRGIDVSQKAIDKARELLVDCESVCCIAGNGVDLSEIPDRSIDCLISFAALTSMPTDVISCYLREMHRVCADDGVIRLQVYLGVEQPVRQNDTLHLRCYQKSYFALAMEKAGFTVEWIRELQLPFQVSFKEVGIEAVIVSLRKSSQMPAAAADISATLLPDGEQEETEILDGEALEYWMSVNYAKELAEQGELEKAREALAYAEVVTKNMSIDVRDSLAELVSKLGPDKAASDASLRQTAKINSAVMAPDAYERNLRVLQERFPDLARVVSDFAGDADSVELRSTGEGPVVLLNGQCLDHPTRPIAGAGNWARQALQSNKVAAARQLVVYGFGGGYHIEQLLEKFAGSVCVIEPSVATFVAVLGSRDLTEILSRVASISVGTATIFDDFNEHSELLVRPQAQGYAPEYYRKLRASFYGVRGLSVLRPKIAVLGPVMGGTLPIMGYTSLALQFMNQRVREIDMSGFASGYNEFSKLISNDVLKANALSSYVETLSKTIVNSVIEKPVDILICMAQAPISGDALNELRKRGVITVLWFVEDYLRFTTWKALAPYYDFIFTIQRDECIRAIQGAGCSEVHYLPTACEPLVHAPISLTPDEMARWGSDVSFVGAGYHNRQQTFASLANYPFKIWGTEWPNCKPFDRLLQEEGRRLKPDEYVRIFNASKINLNLHSSTERDGVDPKGDFLNPRTFELASCGAFQLVDPRTLLGEVFTPGTDIATFETTEELKSRIDYFLSHEDERHAIAQAGRATVHRNHTYQHRLREMLSVIYSSRYEQLKSRHDENPWRKIVAASDEFPELKERCQRAYERGEEATLDALVSDIVTGHGQLSDTEMKLLFLFHVSKQIIQHKREEMGGA